MASPELFGDLVEPWFVFVLLFFSPITCTIKKSWLVLVFDTTYLAYVAHVPSYIGLCLVSQGVLHR